MRRRGFAGSVTTNVARAGTGEFPAVPEGIVKSHVIEQHHETWIDQCEIYRYRSLSEVLFFFARINAWSVAVMRAQTAASSTLVVMVVDTCTICFASRCNLVRGGSFTAGIRL